MEARWRHQRTEAPDEVQGVEQHGSGAVLPRCFEPIANATIVAQLEPLLGDQRARYVATLCGPVSYADRGRQIRPMFRIFRVRDSA